MTCDFEMDDRVSVNEVVEMTAMEEIRKLATKMEEMQCQISSISQQFNDHVTVCTSGKLNYPEVKRCSKSPEVKRRCPKSPDVGGRRRHRTSEDHKQTCLRKSLQTNIVMLIDDLPFMESELADKLISTECLTEDECGDLRRCPSRKDQARNLIRIIKGRSFLVMRKFLNCVNEISPYIAQRIRTTYEDNLKNLATRDDCTFCVLKRSVELKRLADHVWSQNGMSEGLYDEIAACAQTGDMHWQKLAIECNQSEHPKKVMDTICKAIEVKGHYNLLVARLRREVKLECRCYEQKVVSFKLTKSQSEFDEYEGVPSSPNSSIADPMERSHLSDISSHEDLMDIPYDQVLNNIMHDNDVVEMRRTDKVRPKSITCLRLDSFDANINIFRSRSNSFGKTCPFRTPQKRRASMFV